MLRDYYQLTKPGIIRGNVMTAIAGFLLAAQGHIAAKPFFGVIVGTALVIAAGCVYNNVLDRNIDKKMERTQKRALAQGTIAIRSALMYGSTLAVAGFCILVASTNSVTTVLGFVALITYVVFYGIAKRKSVHGTLVGTIPGAIPLVAGYTAAAGQLDTGAVLLFAIMVFWQMPHFYGIGIFRLKDYAKAGLPIMPVVHGIRTTKILIMLYVAAFGLACLLLSRAHYTGITFATVMTIVSLYWLWLGAKGWNTTDDTKWARGMFGFSLLTLLVLSVMLGIESFIA